MSALSHPASHIRRLSADEPSAGARPGMSDHLNPDEPVGTTVAHRPLTINRDSQTPIAPTLAYRSKPPDLAEIRLILGCLEGEKRHGQL